MQEPFPTKVLKAVHLTNDYVASYHGILGMFATIFFGVLYPVNGSLTYINDEKENAGAYQKNLFHIVLLFVRFLL